MHDRGITRSIWNIGRFTINKQCRKDRGLQALKNNLDSTSRCAREIVNRLRNVFDSSEEAFHDLIIRNFIGLT